MKPICSAPLFALLSLITLNGCAGSNNAVPCPQVDVLAQAQTYTSFLPGRSDVAAQITTAQITGLAGSCTLHKKKHEVDLAFQAGFTASNGPANNGASLTLPYFVAITQGENIIQENHYTITLAFDGNASTADASSKPVKIVLPGSREINRLQVLIGFDLTQDQLAYAASHPGP